MKMVKMNKQFTIMKLKNLFLTLGNTPEADHIRYIFYQITPAEAWEQVYTRDSQFSVNRIEEGTDLYYQITEYTEEGRIEAKSLGKMFAHFF